MKAATHEKLDTEQSAYLGRLNLAVQQINSADDLLTKNSGVDAASRQATALLLSAIAKVLVLECAEKAGMNQRLSGFKVF
jgi:hypothetical protein